MYHSSAIPLANMGSVLDGWELYNKDQIQQNNLGRFHFAIRPRFSNINYIPGNSARQELLVLSNSGILLCRWKLNNPTLQGVMY
jgi:hypothetical protein